MSDRDDKADNRLKPRERYERDPQFRMLVDVLTDQIIGCNYTPTELREAVVLATMRYEERYARSSYLMGDDGSFRRIDSYHGRQT